MYGQAGPQAPSDGAAATGYVYDASALGGGYGDANGHQPSFAAPAGGQPMYVAPVTAGFAAIGGYNTVSTADADAQGMGGGRGGAQQI